MKPWLPENTDDEKIYVIPTYKDWFGHFFHLILKWTKKKGFRWFLWALILLHFFAIPLPLVFLLAPLVFVQLQKTGKMLIFLSVLMVTSGAIFSLIGFLDLRLPLIFSGYTANATNSLSYFLSYNTPSVFIAFLLLPLPEPLLFYTLGQLWHFTPDFIQSVQVESALFAFLGGFIVAKILIFFLILQLLHRLAQRLKRFFEQNFSWLTAAGILYFGWVWYYFGNLYLR